MSNEQNMVNFEGISDLTADDVEKQYKQLVLDSGTLDFRIKQDITNQQGTLLVRSGSAIDQATYNRILQHKLLRPLDDYLQFSHQVELNAIVHEMMNMGEEIYGSLDINFDKAIAVIRSVIDELHYDNMMMNKLTVFRSNRIARFNHSIATAFYSSEIGRHMGMSKSQLAELFTVSLFHDIGEMFIEQVIQEKTELTHEDYKAIQVHPIVSYLILKGSKTELSNAVLQGVLNHHERLDGSGYPRRLEKNKLAVYERIMAVIDVYDAIRRKGQTPEDALWAIQLDSYQRSITGETVEPLYDSQIVNILSQRLKEEESFQEDDRDIKAFPHLITEMDNLFTEMNSLNAAVSDLRMKLDSIMLRSGEFPAQADQILHNVRNILYKIRHMIMDSSGLLIDDLHSLMTTVGDYNAIRKDIVRIIPELKTQLQRIQKDIQLPPMQGIHGLEKIMQLTDVLLIKLAMVEKSTGRQYLVH